MRSTASTASCGRCSKAAADAPRPYRFVVLADHGQSLGATFLQRYGVTLQDVVRSLMGGPASVAAATAQIEDWGQLNTFLGEVSQTKGVTGLARAHRHAQQARGRARRDGSGGGAVHAGRSTAARPGDTGTEAPTPGTAATDGQAPAPADLVVVAGGNLALIYFNASKERMSLEAIEEHYPDLVQALANHPGIGVLIVRSAAHGLICVGKDGIHYLDEERVEGEDPLAVYGEHAVAAVKRLDAIEHVGDIAVISHFDPETAGDRRVRGAHRRPRRPGRRADASLPALSVRLGAGPRADHRRADGLPAAAPLDGAASWACTSGRLAPASLPAATPASSAPLAPAAPLRDV